MAWPAGGISTTQLDGDLDSPLLARPSLLAAVQAVNDIAASRGTPSGVASLDSSGKVPLTQIPSGVVPPGVGLDFFGSSLPAGWLWADGSAVSRTTYADLFAAIGTTYGAGDGTTTFNLPDKRDRVTAGKGDMGGSAASRLTTTLTGTRASTSSGVITGLSSTVGLAVGMIAIGTGIGTGAVISSIDSASQVTLSVSSTSTGSGSIRFGVLDSLMLGATGGAGVHALTTAQMPAHTHNFDASGNQYYMLRSTGSGTFGWTSGALPFTSTSTGVQSAGGGQAHPIVQPTLVCNYIIKT